MPKKRGRGRGGDSPAGDPSHPAAPSPSSEPAAGPSRGPSGRGGAGRGGAGRGGQPGRPAAYRPVLFGETPPLSQHAGAQTAPHRAPARTAYAPTLSAAEASPHLSPSPAPQPRPVQAQAELLVQPMATVGLSPGILQPEGGLTAAVRGLAPIAGPLPSTKTQQFPRRPAATARRPGKEVSLLANHFLIRRLPNISLHHYDVDYSPEVKSRKLARLIIAELVKVYRHTDLGSRLPAFDGRKNLYAAGPLPFVGSKDFTVVLRDDDDGSGKPPRERTFKVTLKLVGKPDLEHLQRFLRGQQPDKPEEAISAFEVALQQQAVWRYTPVSRSFFSPAFGKAPLGPGLTAWKGYYQSVRATQSGLTVNLDMSATAFVQPQPLLDYVASNCNKRDKLDFQRGLTDSERIKAKKAIKNLQVTVTHQGNSKRKYRIFDVSRVPANELTFKLEDGRELTVARYFVEKYGLQLQYPKLPALQVSPPPPRGPQTAPPKITYMPMEVCNICEGQKYLKKLDHRQTDAMLGIACVSPGQRKRSIEEIVQRNAYNSDEWCQEFGIQVEPQMARIKGRVLPAPELKYGDTGREKVVKPQTGAWNMRDKTVYTGGRLQYWSAVNFAVGDRAAQAFLGQLARMCNTTGMVMVQQPAVPVVSAQLNSQRDLLNSIGQQVRLAQHRNTPLQLLICILPDNNGSIYGDLKRLCETEIDVMTQCCLAKHVSKFEVKGDPNYLANLCLKMNVKVGGRNNVLLAEHSRMIPLVSDRPTIIFGADVTHPSPGEDAIPSVAAVVASQDWPLVNQYVGLVSAQTTRKEMISELYTEGRDAQGQVIYGGMIREHLLNFYRKTGRKPERIIFYRDGVSEGQFDQVLRYELFAIRKACASLASNDGQVYQPPVTFLSVQKRHHTRLFPEDSRTADRSGNVLAGTVVDSDICHPTEFDFFLCSHAGLKGTSRPAHYKVLHDDNGFGADQLQALTYNLCYTYARATKAVSLVPPAYYAHLLAFRARFYLDERSSESGSQTSGASSSMGSAETLPKPKDSVKRFMFYC